MLEKEFGLILKIFWGILVPWTLLFFFIYFVITFPEIEYKGVPYPDTALAAGWMLVVVAWIVLPLGMIYAYLNSTKETFYEKVRDCCQPSEIWKPQDETVKIHWLNFSWWSLNWSDQK